MRYHKMIQKWYLMIITLLNLLAVEAMATEKQETPGNLHCDVYKAVWDAVLNADLLFCVG